MEDYRLPAPLVGMLKATNLSGMPHVQTDLRTTKISVTITWDLATSAPKKPKKQPAKKKPSETSAPTRHQLQTSQCPPPETPTLPVTNASHHCPTTSDSAIAFTNGTTSHQETTSRTVATDAHQRTHSSARDQAYASCSTPTIRRRIQGQKGQVRDSPYQLHQPSRQDQLRP